MIRNDIFVNVTLNATVSHLVKAKSRTHALKTADFQINEETIVMDQIQLINEQGAGKSFKVKRIEAVHWEAAEAEEYSNHFKVAGQIRLELYVPFTMELVEENLWEAGYKLPKASFQDITIWVIPTSNGPVFTQVKSQSFEWKVKTRTSNSFIKAG
ncbi:hypothetical protein ACFPYJ_02010 [Paenibacillus solisilvae]|uniref:Arrestin-like N-terminal domain-containing protein n=1 Tax=Paenibacillus solisilvae TaxID=2486751 RepID=A0ABW0VSP8_9BACL